MNVENAHLTRLYTTTHQPEDTQNLARRVEYDTCKLGRRVSNTSVKFISSSELQQNTGTRHNVDLLEQHIVWIEVGVHAICPCI